MALPRRPLSSWANILRQRSTTTARTAYARQPWRQARTRGYATEHGGATKSSDIPWALGAVAVTAPTMWYLGIYTPDPNAHHGHDEHKEEGEDEGEKEEEKEDNQDDQKDDQKDDEKDDEKDDQKDDQKDDEKDEGSDTREKDSAKKDEADPNKKPKSSNQMSGKQEGIANADTKHSTDPVADGKSGKPEGGADTAKAKGTVDVNRSQK